MSLEVNKIIGKYFMEYAKVPMVIADTKGMVIAYNQSFADLVNIESKIIGQQVQKLLPYEVRVEDSGDVQLKSIKAEMVTENNSKIHLDGHLFQLDELMLMLYEKNMITETEIIERMSQMNFEMSAMARELTKKNQSLNNANIRITELLNVDYLTELYNRRYFFERIEENIGLLKRHHCDGLGLISIDIDFFKYYNDTYGHDVGDEVLKLFAKNLLAHVRNEDVVARIGGEEFAIIVLCTKDTNIQVMAEKLRASCENLKYDHVDRPIQASFGVTMYIEGESISDLLKRADVCLYEAKEKGRNCVVYHQ